MRGKYLYEGACMRHTAPQSDYFNKMFVRIHNIRWIVVDAFNLDHNLAVWQVTFWIWSAYLGFGCSRTLEVARFLVDT